MWFIKTRFRNKICQVRCWFIAWILSLSSTISSRTQRSKYFSFFGSFGKCILAHAIASSLKWICCNCGVHVWRKVSKVWTTWCLMNRLSERGKKGTCYVHKMSTCGRKHTLLFTCKWRVRLHRLPRRLNHLHRRLCFPEFCNLSLRSRFNKTLKRMPYAKDLMKFWQDNSIKMVGPLSLPFPWHRFGPASGWDNSKFQTY